jgi:hypothetical protein
MGKRSGGKSVRSGRGGVVVDIGVPGVKALIRDRRAVSPLLGGLVRSIAARVWEDVTGGAGVVLDEQGKPVKPGGGR